MALQIRRNRGRSYAQNDKDVREISPVSGHAFKLLDRGLVSVGDEVWGQVVPWLQNKSPEMQARMRENDCVE